MTIKLKLAYSFTMPHPVEYHLIFYALSFLMISLKPCKYLCYMIHEKM